MTNMNTIGTCSICAGPVQVPAVWMAVIPPTPQCAQCGAVPANNYGPVIDMQPSQSFPPQTESWIPPETFTGIHSAGSASNVIPLGEMPLLRSCNATATEVSDV